MSDVLMHYWPADGGFGCNAPSGFRSSYLWAVTCPRCIGPAQRALLDRAPGRLVMALDAPERKAAMRLVKRGILTRQRFGGPGLGYITVYRITT